MFNASERAYQALPCTRRISVCASGEWTAARHLIGYPLTNRIPHAAFLVNALFMCYKRTWLSCYPQQTPRARLSQLGLFRVLTPGSRCNNHDILLQSLSVFQYSAANNGIAMATYLKVEKVKGLKLNNEIKMSTFHQKSCLLKGALCQLLAENDIPVILN